MVEDDRNNIKPGDPVLLVIEDDVTFARILVDMARSNHLKAVVALRGATALSLAPQYAPNAAGHFLKRFEYLAHSSADCRGDTR